MTDADLLYRRALCKGKPYCFLMNSRFEEFSHELVEKYMKRALAYGMFPGFFSHNASEGHYFTRPELYDRDRPLFTKYVPLCRKVAEAGWEPMTRRDQQRRTCDCRAIWRSVSDRVQRQSADASRHGPDGAAGTGVEPGVGNRPGIDVARWCDQLGTGPRRRGCDRVEIGVSFWPTVGCCRV